MRRKLLLLRVVEAITAVIEAAKVPTARQPISPMPCRTRSQAILV